MNQKSIIPISALVVFGTITLANIQNNGRLPGSREWLGFIIVYTMLSAAADLGLPIAGGFAILVMLTVLLTRGIEALKYLTGKIKPLPQPKPKRGGGLQPAPAAPRVQKA